MRYAIPKKTAQAAMMATMITTTIAQTTHNTTTDTTDNMNSNNFVFLTLFALAVALMANLMWYLMTTSWTRRRTLTMPPSKNDTMDSHAQTNEDRPLLTLIELRRREKNPGR